MVRMTLKWGSNGTFLEHTVYSWSAHQSIQNLALINLLQRPLFTGGVWAKKGGVASLPIFLWWAWGSARMRTHFPLTSVHFRRQVCLHRALGFWSCTRTQLSLKKGRPKTRQCEEVGSRATDPSCLESCHQSASFTPQVSDLVLP